MSATIDPWFKFFGFDWRADERLALVSLAARGLWLEMLIIMHSAKPRGHLLVNGDPPTDAQLAQLARAPLDEVCARLQDLDAAGVFSRTRAGVIFSRRMVKDERRAKEGRKSVEKRWKNAKSATPQASDSKGKSDTPNRYPTTHMPDAICQMPEEESPSSLRSEGQPTAPAASAAAPASGSVASIDAVLWGACRTYIAQACSVTDAQARKVIGDWRRAYGPGEAAAAIAVAQKENPELPIPYIAAILQRRRKTANQQNGRPTRLGPGI